MHLKFFTSSACGPCAMMKKSLEDNPPSVPVEYIDVGEQPVVANAHRVSTVPTIELYDSNDELLRRNEGSMTPAKLHSMIEEFSG